MPVLNCGLPCLTMLTSLHVLCFNTVQGGVQRLLADSQATLIADQQRLARLVAQVNAERDSQNQE